MIQLNYKLKRDLTLRNTSNDGLSAFSKKWKEPSFIYLKKGAVINFEKKEYAGNRVGYHFSYKSDGMIFTWLPMFSG